MTGPAGPPGRPVRSHLGGEGEPTVFVADEQSAHPVPLDRLNALALHVIEQEGVRGGCELNLLFVDEEAIADLNEQHMGEEGPTDVLAFPIDDDLSAEPGRQPDGSSSGPERVTDLADLPALLGDVVVCPPIAARNAPEHAGTYDDELDLLVVHGILHVLGWDHVGSEETAKMDARQAELLASFVAPDPTVPDGRRRP